MSIKMGDVFWKVDRLAEGAVHLVQHETGERRELTLAQWVSGVGTGVVEVLSSKRAPLGQRDELRVGLRMRFDDETWKVQVVKDGVIHLVNAASDTTKTITFAAWQKGCFEGEIDMLGNASAELPDSIRDLLAIPLTSFPKLMQDYVRWATVFVAAYKDPRGFYREHLPDLPKKERSYPHFLSRKWLEPFLRAVASATGEDKPGASTFCKWLVKIALADGDMRAVAPRFDCKGPHHRYMSPSRRGMAGRSHRPRLAATRQIQEEACFRGARLRDGRLERSEPRLPGPDADRGACELLYPRDGRPLRLRRPPQGHQGTRKEFRQVGEGPKTTYFLERVEMDHTRANVDVLHDEGTVKLGRPWITAALDHYTRLPIGVVVHFLDQSVAAVFLGLRNMMMLKGFLPKLVPEIDYDYPSGVCVNAFMDRGTDWDTDSVRFVLGTFGVIPQYEPVACPNFKGAIERWNATLQHEVSHTLPGATPPWSTDGYVWDDEGKAHITLSAFVRRLWRWVTMVYAKTWHRGIEDVPLERWKGSVARKMPRALRPKDDLNVLLTRIVECGVSNKGVEHEGLRWGGAAIERIMANPAFRPGMKVRIRIDDLDVQNAWVINPWTAVDEKLEPVLKSYMAGLNWYAHDVARKDRLEKGKEARKESSMVRSKHRMRTQAEEFMDGKSGGGKPRIAAARVLGIGSRKPAGDDLGGVLPDPDAVLDTAAPNPALHPERLEEASAIPSVPAQPRARPASRRVPNH